MIELLPFLKSLLSAPGLSGYEAPVRELIAEAWRPLVDELSVSRVGSLHGLRRGESRAHGEGEPRRPSVLLAAHMDAIGLMVAGTAPGGFLRVSNIGGVDPRVLPGQPVTVHGREDLPAVIVQPSARLLPADQASGPVDREYLLVDTGLAAADVTRLVQVGDPVSFAQPPLELAGGVIAGHSLDNRASVAALTVCLDELRLRRPAWDVWAVATAQEETLLLGAFTSGFAIQPDLAVAVDVTFAKGPGASDHRTVGFGKGPTLGWGANIHAGLFRQFKDLADQLEIPVQTEVMPGMSGTDGVGLQVTAAGIPTMVLGLPLRYMHTPVEAVVLKDIQRAGRLLAEWITRLEPDALQTLSLENGA